jgi:hypothetical protein
MNDWNVTTMSPLAGGLTVGCIRAGTRKQEKIVRKIATNTIGYTRKQARKEWFDEECEKVNGEKNACRANAIHRRTRAAKDQYRPKRRNYKLTANIQQENTHT